MHLASPASIVANSRRVASATSRPSPSCNPTPDSGAPRPTKKRPCHVDRPHTGTPPHRGGSIIRPIQRRIHDRKARRLHASSEPSPRSAFGSTGAGTQDEQHLSE